MLENSRRILVIDEIKSATAMAQMLEREGYNACAASDLTSAEMSITTWTPDLIIANIFHTAFPVMDFIGELRRTPGVEGQKALIISVQPEIELITGENPAVQGYLYKPVDFTELGALLKKHCGQTSAAKRLSVVVADSDGKSIDLTRRFLETSYYNPVCAQTASAAFSAMQRENPSALIIDPVLPDQNGFSFIAEVRKNFPKTPIVVVSALRLNQFQEYGACTGYPELIAKEIPQEFLLHLIEKNLSQDEGKAGPKKPSKPRVLIAEDQPILLDLMKEMLEKSGFVVYTACNGQEAIDAVKKNPPDIAVLDFEMPVKDGLLAAQEIKADPLFASIPIMILTAISDRQVKLKSLALGIDDYLTKPIDTDELVARIRMILKRTKQVLDANPLTRLPGNPSIQARIEKEIAGGNKFAVLYVDLNQFKSFNDGYGFEAGDAVIKATANILITSTKQHGTASDFIGHIGGDDFISRLHTFNRQAGQYTKISFPHHINRHSA
ncbi:MAG: response regulator [Elusimicrobia bacterium]|nr:response regulator [Elusimicrobiota bacterium]